VEVGAGENWDSFVKEVVDRGLYGVENLSGIPGTVGATPIQNVGAYGTEVSDVLKWVEVFDQESGKVVRLNSAKCRFEYRDSIFKQPEGRRYIVTRVCFRLSASGSPNLSYRDLAEQFADVREEPALAAIRDAVLRIRANKFPDLKEVGTAGSFFKNPIIEEEHGKKLREIHPDMLMFPTRSGRHVKVSLAWILDHVCQMRGVRRGNVGTYERQPLVFITYKGATAAEVHAFAKEIADKVFNETGIVVTPEVTHVV